jgi:hypothetical protein
MLYNIVSLKKYKTSEYKIDFLLMLPWQQIQCIYFGNRWIKFNVQFHISQQDAKVQHKISSCASCEVFCNVNQAAYLAEIKTEK